MSINKNILTGSRNLPQCSPYQGWYLHRKGIHVLLWYKGTHGHSGRQGPSDRSGV